MRFLELNGSRSRTQTRTYLLGCERTRQAVLIDPEFDHNSHYLAVLAYHGLKLAYVVDTHTHADHLTGGFDLMKLTGAHYAMHESAPNPRVDVHLKEGDSLEVGDIHLRVLHTPGHTPDSLSLVGSGRVYTGDVLLIGGTGRADFAGGNAADQYHAVVQKLFTLPDETEVYPGHDYRGNTVSTIGHEKRHNPRLAGKSEAEYVELMNSIQFPLPDKIQEVLQPNQTAIEDDVKNFPRLAQLNEVMQMSAEELQGQLQAHWPVSLLDVREPQEFTGDLGHLTGARLIPLKELTTRVGEISPWKDSHVVVVCRSGVRSTTAAAMLTALGFSNVSNLKGGMLDWNKKRFPTER